MIISRLSDGLGNQLFQYAAGRSLAARLDTDYRIDVAAYADPSSRPLGINHFNISAKPATDWELGRLCARAGIERAVRRLIPSPAKGLLLRTLSHLLPPVPQQTAFTPVPTASRPLLMSGNVAAERNLGFDVQIRNCPEDTYLVGYWQSEKYFSESESIIRNELTLRTAPSQANIALASQIQSQHSVSIHIRRGDKAGSQFFFPSEPSWCFKAIEYLRALHSDLVFFVFSDDWAWVKTHLPQSSSIIHVDHNSHGDAHEDLHLMTLCKHNIIASSSLSWWGAWLNTNVSKIVVTPPAQNWCRFEGARFDDLLPGNWTVLQ